MYAPPLSSRHPTLRALTYCYFARCGPSPCHSPTTRTLTRAHTGTGQYFYGVAGAFFTGTPLAIAVSVYSAILALALTSWFLVSLVDASNKPYEWEDKFTSMFHCMGKVSLNSRRYCSICKKEVLGLDHHCPWLNT